MYIMCNNICILVGKDSFASILYANALNQFFLAFLVPVVIELGIEGKFIVIIS